MRFTCFGSAGYIYTISLLYSYIFQHFLTFSYNFHHLKRLIRTSKIYPDVRSARSVDTQLYIYFSQLTMFLLLIRGLVYFQEGTSITEMEETVMKWIQWKLFVVCGLAFVLYLQHLSCLGGKDHCEDSVLFVYALYLCY